MSRFPTEMNLTADPSVSHIAEMMIRGNTVGAIKMVRHLHDYDSPDQEIRSLAITQLQTAQDNIEEMKTFL